MKEVNVIFDGEQYGRVYKFLADEKMDLKEEQLVVVDTQYGPKLARITNKQSDFKGEVSRCVLTVIDEKYIEETKKQAKLEQDNEKKRIETLRKMAEYVKERKLVDIISDFAAEEDDYAKSLLYDYLDTV